MMAAGQLDVHPSVAPFGRSLGGIVAPRPAAVEDPALVEHDGLEETVLVEVGHELAELRAVDRAQREQGGSWVELEVGGRWRAALVLQDVRTPRRFAQVPRIDGACVHQVFLLVRPTQLRGGGWSSPDSNSPSPSSTPMPTPKMLNSVTHANSTRNRVSSGASKRCPTSG